MINLNLNKEVFVGNSRAITPLHCVAAINILLMLHKAKLSL